MGLLQAQFWERDIKGFGKSRQRYRDPIEAKESMKWLRSHKEASIAQQRLEGTKVVSVGDREADIYELFLQAKQMEGSADLLVRALHRNRVLEVEGDGPKHLLSYLESRPSAECFRMTVTSNNSGGPRTAQMELRFAPVRLKRPSDKRRFKTPIDLWGILAKEVGWKGKDEHRIEWLLLTTLPVRTLEECKEKIEWYKLRWTIEVYHRVLKSGCAVEARQLRKAKSLEKCVAVDLVMAIDVLNLTKLAREKPNEPCTIALEDLQWKTLLAYRTNSKVEPKEPPTIREAVRMIAKLGGFLGRKCDKEPGQTTVWRGLQHLNDMVVGFAIMWGFAVPKRPPPPPIEEEDDW